MRAALALAVLCAAGCASRLLTFDVPDLGTAQNGSDLAIAGDLAFGTFSRVHVSVPSCDVAAIGHGDFNGDGKDDLALACGANGERNGLVVLYGNGDGTYAAWRPSTGELDFQRIVIGDFDGDKKPDVIASSAGGQGFLELLDNGAQAETVWGGMATGLAAADFDGDGKLDIALALQRTTGPVIEWALGQINGDFGTPSTLKLKEGQLRRLVAGDFVVAGRIDLAVGTDQPHVTLLTGDGTGKLAESAQVFLPTGASADVLAAGDLDGDGLADLLVSDGNGGGLYVIANHGGFLARRIGEPYGIYDGAIGDLDGDGKPDVVITDGISGLFFRQGANGSFEAPGVTGQVRNARAVAIADENRDRMNDIIVGSNESIDVFLNRAP